MAAAREARLVVSARDAAALHALAAEIDAADGTAMAVPADAAIPVRGGLRSLYLTGQEQRRLRHAAVAGPAST